MTKIASTKLLKGHTDKVLALDLDATDRLIVSGSQDKTVRLWDLNANKTNILRGHGGSDWFSKVNAVAISTSLNLIASGGDDQTVRLWSLVTHQQVKTFTGQQGVTSLAMDREGRLLASGSQDRTIILWSLETDQRLYTLDGHTDGVLSLCFSPDGKFLASGGDGGDKTVRIWSLADQSSLLFKGHSDWFGGVSGVAFHPNGRLILSGSKDKTIKIWDINQAQDIMTLTDHTDEVNSVAISPNGKILASGSKDKTLKLWDLAKGTLITTIPHQGSVTAVKFGRSQNIVITACEDKIIRIFSGLFPQKILLLDIPTV
jgi:WD40 repeat protein